MESQTPTPGSPVDWRALRWLLAANLLSLVLFLVGSPDGFSNWEELHTPSAALMILNGYYGDILGMQYMTFCGGCSVDALLAVPLTALGGPSLLLWKLVPWGFSMLVLGCGYWVVDRWAGRYAAILYGLFVVLAPTAYHHLLMVGFSNHVQVMGLVWLSLVAWTRALETEGLGWPFATGLFLGLSFYYCYTSAFALPVLLLLYFAWRPRDLLRLRGWALAFGLALPLGWWAWAQTHMPAKAGIDVPFFGVYQLEAGSMVSIENVISRLPRLGPTCWRSLFAPSLGEGTLVLGAGIALVFALGMLGALIYAVRTLVQRRARPLDMAIPGLALAFVAAYLLVDTAATADMSRIWHPEYLRYQAPLLSLASACSAGTIVRLWHRQFRVPAVILAMLMLGPGLSGRLAAVQVEQITARPLFLHSTTWLTIGNRINVPEFDAIEDIRELVDGRHPIALRVMLGNLGGAVGRAALEFDDPAARKSLTTWIAELSPEDQANLLRGVAPLVQDRYQNHAEDDPRLLSLFESLGPAATCVLRREQYRIDATSQANRFAAWDQNPHGSPPLADGPCPVEAGDWAYGYLLMSWGHISTERDYGNPMAALAGTGFTLGSLEPERRLAFVEGVGERAGELWGFNPWARRRLRESIQSELVPAFDEGFERGARWAFVWPAAI